MPYLPGLEQGDDVVRRLDMDDRVPVLWGAAVALCVGGMPPVAQPGRAAGYAGALVVQIHPGGPTGNAAGTRRDGWRDSFCELRGCEPGSVVGEC